MTEADFPEIVALRKKGDEAWEHGKKAIADAYHREASDLAGKHGLNVVKCDRCGGYWYARELPTHNCIWWLMK